MNYTDIQGRLLVGGNAWLNNVAVGMEIFQYKYLPCDKLPLGSPQYAVVVGGAVFTLGGSIHNGDLAYGNSTSNVSVSTGFNAGCYGYAQPVCRNQNEQKKQLFTSLCIFLRPIQFQ